MSEFYQFEVTGIARKMDGKEYTPGSKFPYEPGNPKHKRLLDLNMIKVVEASNPTTTSRKPRTSKK